ncbi:ras guanine nucleotide exchange factor domain-containing protein [Globomyces pollinis-pini]|nr:ras guanine nucleotide exchange factor domain-containing protein [Globomyces pollinis-pini]
MSTIMLNKKSRVGSVTEDKILLSKPSERRGSEIPDVQLLAVRYRSSSDIAADKVSNSKSKYSYGVAETNAESLPNIDTGRPKSRFIEATPTLKVSTSTTLLELLPIELAKQIIIMDANCFTSIDRKEFEEMKWGGINKATDAPRIVESTLHFNQLALWVAQEILNCEKIQNRFQVLGFFIHVANHCLKYDDFSGLKAIVSGLQSGPIYRLTRTWEMLGRKEKELYQKLTEVTSIDNNNEKYRRKITGSKRPCIPYLGINLMDLTYVWECIKKDRDNRERISQYTERKLQFQQLIDDIVDFQLSCVYSFERKQDIIDTIKFNYTIPTEEIKNFQDHQYTKSYELENKNMQNSPKPLEKEEWKFSSLKLRGDKNKNSIDTGGIALIPESTEERSSVNGPKLALDLSPQTKRGFLYGKKTKESDDENDEVSKFNLKSSIYGLMKTFGRKKTIKGLPGSTISENQMSNHPIRTTSESRFECTSGMDSGEGEDEDEGDLEMNQELESNNHLNDSKQDFSNQVSASTPSVAPLTGKLHLQAYLFKKDEFDAEGNRSTNRKWTKVWVVLDGTSLIFYSDEPKNISLSKSSFQSEKNLDLNFYLLIVSIPMK